jgi:pyridoxal phosphate enzyme (YggS family)
MPEPSPIAAALASIRARIEAAATQAGRDPAAITLVAVSKTHGADAVAEAIAAGQLIFGENRLQEAQAKFPALLAAHPGTKLHLIGGLQTNKAKDAVKLCHMIESLDRETLADAIAKAADTHGACPDLLVQINIGDEPQKSGAPTANADQFIRAMQTRFGAHLKGLMCIPPAETNPTPYFRHLASLADTHNLPIRSMGMSADFETAIAEGATHIRLGSAIFGGRGEARPGGLRPPGPPTKG